MLFKHRIDVKIIIIYETQYSQLHSVHLHGYVW